MDEHDKNKLEIDQQSQKKNETVNQRDMLRTKQKQPMNYLWWQIKGA